MKKLQILLCCILLLGLLITGCSRSSRIDSDLETEAALADTEVEDINTNEENDDNTVNEEVESEALTQSEEVEESPTFPVLTGDYFNQTPPGIIAEIFAPGIISLTDSLESAIVFSPDSNLIYFQRYTSDFASMILYTECQDDVWTEPVEAPFAIDKNLQLASVSPDGNRLYLNTNVHYKSDLFKIEHTSEGWGELELLPAPINSDASEGSYQEMADGTGYLSSTRDGSSIRDIWRINSLTDGTMESVNLGPVLNSNRADYGPCIAPDGSYMIFGSDRNGRSGVAHLYVSFDDGNGGWTEPVNLNSSGAQINDNSANQGFASLSPDGAYLFFNRHYNMTTMDIYWVSTSFIEDIKELVFN